MVIVVDIDTIVFVSSVVVVVFVAAVAVAAVSFVFITENIVKLSTILHFPCYMLTLSILKSNNNNDTIIILFMLFLIIPICFFLFEANYAKFLM